MKYFLMIIVALINVGCSTITDIVIDPLSDFPARPPLKEYTVPPIIQKIDTNFLVRSDFIENSILLKDYDDRIEEWKEKHQIR